MQLIRVLRKQGRIFAQNRQNHADQGDAKELGKKEQADDSEK